MTHRYSRSIESIRSIFKPAGSTFHVYVSISRCDVTGVDLSWASTARTTSWLDPKRSYSDVKSGTWKWTRHSRVRHGRAFDSKATSRSLKRVNDESHRSTTWCR